MHNYVLRGRAILLPRLAPLVAAAVLLTACGSSASSSSSTSSSTGGAAQSSTGGNQPLSGKTIAYIKTGDLEYYNYSAKGAQAAVAKLGGTTKVYDSQLNPATELANVRNAVTAKVNGIVLFPLSDASAQAEVRLANAAKIPVVLLYGFSANPPPAAGFVQINFSNYAEALGKAFAKIVPTGDVAMITGQPGRSEVVAFDAGFQKGFGRHFVTILSGDYLRQKALSDAQDIIAKYPNLTGLVVGNEDMAAGAIGGLGSKISQVAVAAQNGSPEGNTLLKAGKLKATVGGSPSQEAAMAVKLVQMAIAGNPMGEKLCGTPWAVNTSSDIKSVTWVPTSQVISSSLTDPPPCSSK